MGSSEKRERSAGELVQGTLDMLILRVLNAGPMHGWGISQRVHQITDQVLRIEEGSLYPALHRLELAGYLDAEWGPSENNRRAKYYRLTAQGRKQLASEKDRWARLTTAITRVMETA